MKPSMNEILLQPNLSFLPAKSLLPSIVNPNKGHQQTTKIKQ
jgi:hypothetical protein